MDLNSLYKYLSQKPTEDVKGMIRNGGNEGFEQEAYNYFEPKKILHDVYIIHFTNMEGYENIPNEGFKMGSSDVKNLAYSNGGVSGGKISFGFLLDNPYVEDYDLGYGDCALVFKTDGILAYHKIDGDDEVIFFNNSIKSDIHRLIFDDDERCWYCDDVPCGDLKNAINKAISKEKAIYNKNIKEMKQLVKINESQLQEIVAESVKKALSEIAKVSKKEKMPFDSKVDAKKKKAFNGKADRKAKKYPINTDEED